MTRDSWILYLARLFRGQVLEREKELENAERAYRGALAAVPNAQAASTALAAVLFTDGRRREAWAAIDRRTKPIPSADQSLSWLSSRRRSLLAGADGGLPAEECGDDSVCKAAVVAMVSCLRGSRRLLAASTPHTGCLQQPIFRGGADAVTVDVVVKDGGRVVGGLTTSDFGLRGRPGVSQTIDRVVATAVPVDVTLIVDVSGGLERDPGDASAFGRRQCRGEQVARDHCSDVAPG